MGILKVSNGNIEKLNEIALKKNLTETLPKHPCLKF